MSIGFDPIDTHMELRVISLEPMDDQALKAALERRADGVAPILFASYSGRDEDTYARELWAAPTRHPHFPQPPPQAWETHFKEGGLEIRVWPGAIGRLISASHGMRHLSVTSALFMAPLLDAEMKVLEMEVGILPEQAPAYRRQGRQLLPEQEVSCLLDPLASRALTAAYEACGWLFLLLATQRPLGVLAVSQLEIEPE